jgi:two-component system sensor histidine kinase DesK
VAFEVIDGELCVTVSDNGRGGILAEGNGLTGMRERVRALGGRLQIRSQRGQGTQLRVVVPRPDRLRPAPASGAEPAAAVLRLEPRPS